MTLLRLLGLLAFLGPLSCAPADGTVTGDTIPRDPDAFVTADSARILQDLQTLSHDSMEGRRTGTPGGVRAREYVLASFRETGLQGPPAGYVQPFEVRNRRDTTQVAEGANVVGYVPGTDPAAGAIVLTAHYDHLGIRAPRAGSPDEARGDSLFNGADDNASGTVGIMAMARYFAVHPPRHTVVFAALDAEESGSRGARDFVARGWPEHIVLNVNLDMIARSDSILWVAGPFHYPQLRTILEKVEGRPPVVFSFGHDQPGVEGMDDWTRSSDHSAFHAQGIPFIYFGVEDHPDYHRASDEFEKVDPAFFLNAVRAVLAATLALDAEVQGPQDAERPGAGEGEVGGVPDPEAPVP